MNWHITTEKAGLVKYSKSLRSAQYIWFLVVIHSFLQHVYILTAQEIFLFVSEANYFLPNSSKLSTGSANFHFLDGTILTCGLVDVSFGSADFFASSNPYPKEKHGLWTEANLSAGLLWVIQYSGTGTMWSFAVEMAYNVDCIGQHECTYELGITLAGFTLLNLSLTPHKCLSEMSQSQILMLPILSTAHTKHISDNMDEFSNSALSSESINCSLEKSSDHNSSMSACEFLISFSHKCSNSYLDRSANNKPKNKPVVMTKMCKSKMLIV